MYIFFSTKKKKDNLYIEGSENQHLKVRRIKKGEEIGVIYAKELYLCIVEEVKTDYSRTKIIQKIEVEEPCIKISLYQCVTQDIKTMDLIIQKSVEIGVYSITPVLSSRSFSKIDAIEKRINRWKRIIQEAMKQCGRPEPLKINEPLFLKDMKPAEGTNIFLYNSKVSKNIKRIQINSGFVYVLTGPEGGLSQGEVEFLIDSGFIPVKIGPYTLRSETASIVACGMLINLAVS